MRAHDRRVGRSRAGRVALASASPFRHGRDARPCRDETPLRNLELASGPRLTIRQLQGGQAQEIECLDECVDSLGREAQERIAARQELFLIDGKDGSERVRDARILFHPATFELDRGSACQCQTDPAVVLLCRYRHRRGFAVDVSGLDRRITRPRSRP